VWFLIRTGKPHIGSVLNGTLAGLVGVTAGAHAYSTLDAVMVGVISAALMQVATQVLQNKRIDDVVGAFPVHAVAGLSGTLLVAILGDQSLFPNNHGHIQQLGIQLVGASVVIIWSLGVGFGSLWLLNTFHPMRVSQTDELQGLNVSEHEATTEVQDLLGTMVRQSTSGNFASKVEVEPHTEVGQIFSTYLKTQMKALFSFQQQATFKKPIPLQQTY